MANNYKLHGTLDLKTLYEIIDKRNIICFESYDADQYYYYDLTDESCIPIFLGLLCSETELLSKIFACDKGMYGIAAKNIIMQIIELMEEYPDYVAYIRNIDVSLAFDHSMYKFLIWVLSNKLKYTLEYEPSSSYNVRLCISKIKSVLGNFRNNSYNFLIPILGNCGLGVVESDNFRVGNFLETVLKNDLEALPRSNEVFSTEEMSETLTSDDAATVCLS